jgi:flavin-binding protein dodecin
MSDHVYSISEIVGSSEESIDDAIRKAVRSTAATKRNVEWFTTEEIRGHIVDGEVGHFQVTLKVGFRLDDPQP